MVLTTPEPILESTQLTLGRDRTISWEDESPANRFLQKGWEGRRKLQELFQCFKTEPYIERIYTSNHTNKHKGISSPSYNSHFSRIVQSILHSGSRIVYAILFTYWNLTEWSLARPWSTFPCAQSGCWCNTSHEQAESCVIHNTYTMIKTIALLMIIRLEVDGDTLRYFQATELVSYSSITRLLR